MTTPNIPKEIAHLDFNPDVEEQTEDVELHECQIARCTNVATWVARVNCCKYDARFCGYHKRVIARIGALCSKQRCGKSREARWFTNWRQI